MKRLWPSAVPLQKRRDMEAVMFEKGFAAAQGDTAGPPKN